MLDDPVTLDQAEPEADVVAWTVARLLALAGERGEADKVAASVLTPSGKWSPPWLMCGHKARQEHQLDPAPIRSKARTLAGRL